MKVSRISQDGARIRVGAGGSSFRREERLQELLVQAQQQVLELRRQREWPERGGNDGSAESGAQRAAGRGQQRLQQAIAQLPEVKQSGRGDCKGWPGSVGKKDPGAQAAGEHDGRGGAGDEDGERRL